MSRPQFIRPGANRGVGAVTKSTWSQDRPYPTKVIKIIVPFPTGVSLPGAHSKRRFEERSARACRSAHHPTAFLEGTP